MNTRLLGLRFAFALLLAALCAHPLAAQQQPAPAPGAPVACDSEGYALFTAAGNPLSWERMLAEAARADVVFLGENHDDRRGHCLQHRIFRALHLAAGRRPVILSLEMFERDTQVVLNEYLRGLIDERLFLAAARPWTHYKEDYRPLVEYAREQKIPVIAANAPRRYVTITARKGPEVLNSVSPEAKAWLPPLPLQPASAAYREQFFGVMGNLNPAGPCADADELAIGAAKPDPHAAAHSSSAQKPAPDGTKPAMPSMANLIESQSLWDASMADAIADALRAHPNPLAVHLNGAFHTENGLGILERLQSYRPGTRSFVVGIYPRRDFRQFDADLKSAGNAILQTDCAVYRKKE